PHTTFFPYTSLFRSDYNVRKQELIINDLKRYGIKTLLVDGYEEITKILREIESRFKKKTIFISGSAEVYSPYEKQESIEFIHKIDRKSTRLNSSHVK